MLIAGSTVLPWMFTAPVHFVLILREGGLDLLLFSFKSLPKGCMRAVRGELWSQEGDFSIPVVSGGLFDYFGLVWVFCYLVWGFFVTE